MLFVDDHMIQNLCQFLLIGGVVMMHTFFICLIKSGIKIFPMSLVNRSSHLKNPWRRRMAKTMAKNPSAIRALIHRGDSTHHQLQVICPVSFRPIKSTVRRPGKLAPLEEYEEDIRRCDEVLMRLL